MHGYEGASRRRQPPGSGRKVGNTATKNDFYNGLAGTHQQRVAIIVRERRIREWEHPARFAGAPGDVIGAAA